MRRSGHPEGGVVRLLGNGRRVGFGAGDFTTLNRGPEKRIAADTIDSLIAAGLDQPSTWICRHACRRPLFYGSSEGLLPRLFGRIEIAEQADQCCENTTRLSAKDFFDQTIDNAHVHGGSPAYMPERRA